MNTLTITSQRPFQRLHPLSLLAQLVSRNASSCLQVVSGSTLWSLYFYEGKLSYTSSSVDPFERLDRHLRQLSRQVPTLVSAIRVQMRLLFETGSDNDFLDNRDYQAVHWLVEQKHLEVGQAVSLIEELAKEVLETFLAIQEGSYEIIEAHSFTGDYPNLCQLDLRPIVEECQQRLRRRQQPQAATKPAAIAQPDFTGQRNYQHIARLARPAYKNDIGPSRPDIAPPAPVETAVNHYTIACVDDSPTILETINTFLEDSSFTVCMINDPVKALMQIVRLKPDLVLLDVGMPNLDGYELCSLLRRHPSFKNTPIIMVTGLTGFIDRAKARMVGASGYLTKPFTQPELLKTVFKHLT
jgi:two-component system, chemotaxis family, response regulator PixG